MPPPPLPLDSPLRTHTKRSLPTHLASTYAHGHISGNARTTATQRAFEARKTSILRSMDAAQIEQAYQQTAAKISALVEDDRKRNEEIDREVDKLTQQREMEKKIFWKFREERARREGGREEGT